MWPAWRLELEMRVLCARHPHLGLLGAPRRYPELRGEPVILGGAPELRLPVVAASEAAQAAGVRVGQPLRQAQQSCPAAGFVPRLAARASHPGRIRRVRSGDEALFLAPLPLDVLPVDPAVTTRLAAFGLDCLGAVAGLGPADRKSTR